MLDSCLPAHVPRRRASDLALVESDDRVVVLHLGHPDRPARILEGSAAVVWHAIDGVSDLDTVVGTVAGQYGLAAEVVAADITSLVEALRADDLLEVEAAA